MSRQRSITLLAIVTLTLIACGALRNTTVGQQTPDGQTIFQSRCAKCHTTTDVRRVGPGLGGLFERERLPNGQPITEDNVRAWITQGGGEMPPQRLLTEELDALIVYLKQLE